MNQPVVTKLGTIIDVSFNDVGVYLRAERIVESPEKVTAEITVQMDIATHNGIRKERVLWSRPSLLDDRSKDAFIQSLEHAVDDKSLRAFSFDEIVTESFAHILSKHREGESVVTLENMNVAVGDIWHVKPLIIQGLPNHLWAQGGSFKSYFAQLTCILCDKGLEKFSLKARPSNALYLDWEQNQNVFMRRVIALQRGLGIEEPTKSGILWKKMYGSFVQSYEVISKICKDNNISYVVFDSMNPALGGNSIDPMVIEQFYSALDSLNVTSLILDHANRSAETTGKPAIYGSAFKYNRSRMVYEIRKKQEELTGKTQIVLYHRKANENPPQSPRGFTVNFVNEEKLNESEGYYEEVIHSVHWEKMQLGQADDEFLKALSMGELVRELVDTHGATDLETLAANISIIKEVTVAVQVIENTVSNSSVLTLDDETRMVDVTYSRSSNGIVEELTKMGARLIEEVPKE